jgi:hypothetical protein
VQRGLRRNSQHASREVEKTGFPSVDRIGRHRYLRLASPKVTEMIEGIVAVALETTPRVRPLSPQAEAVSAARICYDYIAGRLSVDLTDPLVARRYIVLDEKDAEISGREHQLSYRVWNCASSTAFDPRPLLPALPRLDRATPAHRRYARSCDN